MHVLVVFELGLKGIKMCVCVCEVAHPCTFKYYICINNCSIHINYVSQVDLKLK